MPAITLDQLTAQYGAPAAILMDVEGYECRVLAGARATLQTWVIEVHIGVGLEDLGGSVKELLSFFPSPYRLLAMGITGGSLEPVHKDSVLPQERFFLVAQARNEEQTFGRLQ